jgi:hypothetical protein
MERGSTRVVRNLYRSFIGDIYGRVEASFEEEAKKARK